MPTSVTPLLLVILSAVVYQVSQKSIARGAHPLLSLLVTYAVAIAVTLLLFPVFPIREPLGAAIRKINWASLAVGATVVGIELGFLLAYRAGWKISVGSAASNAAVALLLLPIGLLFFGERLSLPNALGVVLCLAGLVLVMR